MSEAPVITEDPLFRVREAAEKLRVSRSQIYMLVRAGLLGCERLPSRTGTDKGSIRIPQSAIDAYRASGRQPASTASP